jgi:hypothetical protein
MGSVIDYIECPNCKEEAFNDFYYKTGEEYTCCQHCGYSRTVEIIERSLPLAKDNYYVTEIPNPYGVYKYKTYGHVGHVWGTLATADNATQFILSHKDDPSIEYAYINRYVDGKHTREVIVNNGPELEPIKQ